MARDKVSSHSGVVPAAQSSLPFPGPMMVACGGPGVVPRELGSVYLCFYHLLLPSAAEERRGRGLVHLSVCLSVINHVYFTRKLFLGPERFFALLIQAAPTCPSQFPQPC